MQEITVSLSENILKLSTVEKGEFKGVSAEISNDVVKEDSIVQTESFAQTVKDLIPQITNKNPRNLAINFIISSHEVILKFVTVSKNDGEIEEQIVKEIGQKLNNVSLENIYFSYLKIAPFVYQFIGVEKDILDKYLEISNLVGVSLKSVVPWVTLLPKFVDINEPAIFISNVSGKQFVALSEFNGIFFTDIFDENRSTDELKKLVEELSIYKRKDPISKVFIYNYDSFSLSPDYNILELEIPNSELEGSKGYEIHLLVDHMFSKDSSLWTSQNNLLNLLPVPLVIESKNKALVPVAVVTVLLLVGAVYGGSRIIGGDRVREVLQNKSSNEVLSESNSVKETTPSETQQVEEEPQEVNLQKEDLIMRIENGAGIPGVAGRTQKIMEDFGYEVESIGNSDELGRTDTLLRFKSNKAGYQDMLQEDMKDFFDTTVGEELEDGLPYDVLIVIGTDAKV